MEKVHLTTFVNELFLNNQARIAIISSIPPRSVVSLLKTTTFQIELNLTRYTINNVMDLFFGVFTLILELT